MDHLDNLKVGLSDDDVYSTADPYEAGIDEVDTPVRSIIIIFDDGSYPAAIFSDQ